VSYCALGFLEKNRDTLSDSVVDMLKDSQDDLVRLLFHGHPSDGTIYMHRGVSLISNNDEYLAEIVNQLSSFNFEQQLKKMLEIDRLWAHNIE
jgi:myosin heavy subunit